MTMPLTSPRMLRAAVAVPSMLLVCLGAVAVAPAHAQTLPSATPTAETPAGAAVPAMPAPRRIDPIVAPVRRVLPNDTSAKARGGKAAVTTAPATQTADRPAVATITTGATSPAPSPPAATGSAAAAPLPPAAVAAASQPVAGGPAKTATLKAALVQKSPTKSATGPTVRSATGTPANIKTAAKPSKPAMGVTAVGAAAPVAKPAKPAKAAKAAAPPLTGRQSLGVRVITCKAGETYEPRSQTCRAAKAIVAPAAKVAKRG